MNKNRFSWIQNNIHKFEYLKPAKGTPKQAWAYSTKEETRVNGPWTLGACGTDTKADPYREALAAANAVDAMAIIKENRPRDICLYGDRIRKNVNAEFYVPKPFVPKYTLDQFNCPNLGFNGSKSYLVWGDSNCGKTHFVLAHFKNPLLVTHIDIVKKLTPEHDAIVFDDLSFTHWPSETVIQLVDTELDRDIHVRYGTAHIPAGTIKVFTHNTKTIFYKPDCLEQHIKAIDRRVEYLHVVGPLYGGLALPTVGVDPVQPMVVQHRAPPRTGTLAGVQNPAVQVEFIVPDTQDVVPNTPDYLLGASQASPMIIDESSYEEETQTDLTEVESESIDLSQI